MRGRGGWEWQCACFSYIVWSTVWSATIVCRICQACTSFCCLAYWSFFCCYLSHPKQWLRVIASDPSFIHFTYLLGLLCTSLRSDHLQKRQKTTGDRKSVV